MGCNKPCNDPCGEVVDPTTQPMDARATELCRALWTCQDILSQTADYLERPEAEKTPENTEAVLRTMRACSDIASSTLTMHATDLLQFLSTEEKKS